MFVFNQGVPHSRVSMLPDVHLGKGAGVAHTDDFHCEVPEEINDLQRLSPQTEDENNGSHDRAQQLLENKHLETNGKVFSHTQWRKHLKILWWNWKTNINNIVNRKLKAAVEYTDILDKNSQLLWYVIMNKYKIIKRRIFFFFLLTALYWKSCENWSLVSYLCALPCQWSGM